MITARAIAERVFDAAQARTQGIIKDVTVTRLLEGAYDPETGTSADTPDNQTGRGVPLTEREVRDIMPDYVAGASDIRMYVLLDANGSIEENDTITWPGLSQPLTVKSVGDVLEQGDVFAVVAI